MLQSKVLTHLARADDLWLWADSLASLNAILQDVAEVAYREIGLVMHWDKGSFAKVGPTATGLAQTERQLRPLGRMEFAANGTCMRLLGVTVQMGRAPQSGKSCRRRRGAPTS